MDAEEIKERVDLMAKVLEYEHALEHVTHQHDGPSCSDCVRLAQSALARTNKDDFTEIARDVLGLYDPTYGDDRLCTCTHPYYRHFDTYDEMLPIGCKYCTCFKFVDAEWSVE